MNNQQQNDLTPSLVASLRRGGDKAAGLLEALYAKPLVRLCWGYLGDMDEAEDAVQDVFCRVLQAAEIPDNFRGWLYKIARNVCLNLRRGRERRIDADELVSAESWLTLASTGPLSRVARHELQSRLGHLVSALSAEHREVLRLRYAENLSRAEIGYVLELPEAVVKSRLCEALKKLRASARLLES